MNKLKTTQNVFAALLTGAISTIASSAIAQEVLKWGHVYESATPYHQAALMAATKFEAATNGRYKIEVFPASQLGKEVALNEGLSLGTVDIIYTGVAFMGQSYPPIAISDFPFTMRDFDHWAAYSESDLFSELAQAYTGITGNHVVNLTYYGARHVTANKPILTPADMVDLKIRTPNAPAYQMFPEITGANPTPMAFSEVYLALQQGVVDAQENPLPTIQFKKFYEVQSNINLTGHITNSLVTIVGPGTVGKLGAEDLKALDAALIDAGKWASAEIVKSENELAALFTEQGVTVNVVDRGPFIDAVSPALSSADMPWAPVIFERLQSIK